MNCLRCGRRVANGASFCDVCAKRTSVPLEESPYLKSPPPIQRKPSSAVWPERKKEKPEKKGNRGLVTAVVLLALACAVVSGVCVFGALRYLDRARDRDRLAAQREENARLSASLSEANAELESARAERQVLLNQIADWERRAAQLERTIDTYRVQDSPTGAPLQAMREEQLRLLEQSAAYIEDIASLESEKRQLTGRCDALEEELRALREKSDFVDEHVVFVENDGTGYYHSYDCALFRKEDYWAYNRSKAISEGYEPCPDCQEEGA